MTKVIFKFNNHVYEEFAYYYYLSDLYQDKLKEISRTDQTGFNSSDWQILPTSAKLSNKFEELGDRVENPSFNPVKDSR